MVKRPIGYDYRQGNLLEPELPLPEPAPQPPPRPGTPPVTPPVTRPVTVEVYQQPAADALAQLVEDLRALDARCRANQALVKLRHRATKAEVADHAAACAEIEARYEAQRKWLRRKIERLDRYLGNPQFAKHEATDTHGTG